MCNPAHCPHTLCPMKCLVLAYSTIVTIIIIIIISIFKEDNVFSIIASLPYGPPVNTDIDYSEPL